MMPSVGLDSPVPLHTAIQLKPFPPSFLAYRTNRLVHQLMFKKGFLLRRDVFGGLADHQLDRLASAIIDELKI